MRNEIAWLTRLWTAVLVTGAVSAVGAVGAASAIDLEVSKCPGGQVCDVSEGHWVKVSATAWNLPAPRSSPRAQIRMRQPSFSGHPPIPRPPQRLRNHSLLPPPGRSSFTISLSRPLRETANADTVLKEPPVDSWTGFDKVQHTTFSFLWTLGSQYVLVNKVEMGERSALPISVGVSATLGLAKEIYDLRRSPSRYFSRRDLVADLVGIAAGVLIILY